MMQVNFSALSEPHDFSPLPSNEIPHQRKAWKQTEDEFMTDLWNPIWKYRPSSWPSSPALYLTALPASEIPKPVTLCGKSASPRIFPRASHLQKGFPQRRGQAEITAVYSPSIMADPARRLSHLAASTLPPTQSLWLEVGDGCLNLFHVVEWSSEHQLPSPPLGLLLFLTPGKDPNAFSFPKLYSKTPYFCSNWPA